MVSVWPGRRRPIRQAGPGHVPVLGTALTGVSPGGRMSRTTTLVAVSRPLLVKRRRKRTGRPGQPIGVRGDPVGRPVDVRVADLALVRVPVVELVAPLAVPFRAAAQFASLS